MSESVSVKSPCVLVCSIEQKSGHCFGCGRSRDEIAGWLDFTDKMRDEIMAELPARVAKLERRPRRVTKRARMRGTTVRRDVLDLS